ncbi:viral capsid protein [Autographa californica nucleopolyhedrovirus]|uniref:Capsid protein p24 n=3 Tax=Autographa californica nuclear polyhedrosis virus TaxID=46015 RepID=P24_NPVAC|nr:viral capsid protein [Autographa californica nucleopolyhedrovirus]P41678.1 RecName: Full=Capsid protein p24 [Autographa californica nucleopolyhedrovirus]AKN58979.1 viral capsid protein [Autographa californica multiple nucleopolyhedrovirus]ARJ58661.1 viral capsid protein [synthetic baculovirus AcMNPV-WIV-Syn1]UVY87241.1 p24-capsid [synthetic construct]AAA66759.1 viral capsid protein [Autographa californica nucleopolyhedrovirus]AGQ56831.1 viral capsid protein [Autographa californica nucleopo
MNTDAQSTSNTRNFMYSPDSSLEVVIITNSDGDHDGYLELTAAAKVMSPFLSNGSSAVWTNAAPSHKLIKNNKNYIHVFGLFKYLSNYNLNNKKRPKEYYTLKSIISDLLMGAQGKVFDPLCEVKTQLCAIQESLNEAISILNVHSNDAAANPPAPDINKLQELIQDLQSEYNKKITFTTDTILENLKNIKDLMCLNK